MSRITDYVLEKEQNGDLIYDPYEGVYTETRKMVLAEEIERLEWEISSLKKALQDKIKEYNEWKLG